MNNQKSFHKKICSVEQIVNKYEIDFPGLWETLSWEFLGRLRNQRVDRVTTWDSFDHICILGEGAFGKVVLSKLKHRNIYVALKIMGKTNLIKSKHVDVAISEKNILSLCHFKYVLRLLTAFQTNDNVCLCLELARGGTLYTFMTDHSPFDAQVTRFYSGQIVLGLQYLHTMHIVYRDLKPDNILIDRHGYLKLADMGIAKLMHESPRTYTFCGTPEYIAPEIILNRGYGLAVDWWSFGVMLYEFFTKRTPFLHNDNLHIFKCIIKCKYKFPHNMADDLRNLISCLLQPDISRRFGNLRNGALDIRYHPFYKVLSWTSLMDQTIRPPFQMEYPDFSTFKKNEEIQHMSDKSETMCFAKEFENF